jgi:hypothetical protein
MRHRRWFRHADPEDVAAGCVFAAILTVIASILGLLGSGIDWLRNKPWLPKSLEKDLYGQAKWGAYLGATAFAACGLIYLRVGHKSQAIKNRLNLTQRTVSEKIEQDDQIPGV